MMFLLSHEPPQRFAVPVLALTGATSYWASVVASPPGHMSDSGARGTGDLWQLPASWPARPIYDANRPSGVSAVQGDRGRGSPSRRRPTAAAVSFGYLWISRGELAWLSLARLDLASGRVPGSRLTTGGLWGCRKRAPATFRCAILYFR